MNSFNHAARQLYTRLHEVVDEQDYAIIKVANNYNVEFHQNGKCILIPEIKQLLRLSSTNLVILTPEEVSSFLDSLFLLSANEADLMSISPSEYGFNTWKCDSEGILGPNLVGKFKISMKGYITRFLLKRKFLWIANTINLT